MKKQSDDGYPMKKCVISFILKLNLSRTIRSKGAQSGVTAIGLVTGTTVHRALVAKMESVNAIQIAGHTGEKRRDEKMATKSAYLVLVFSIK